MIVGQLISGETSGSLLDYQQERVITVSGVIRPDEVAVESNGCLLVGQGNEGRFELRDPARQSRLTLSIGGRHFRGFDHDTDQPFSGTVQGEAVEFFDYQRARWFSYKLGEQDEKKSESHN